MPDEEHAYWKHEARVSTNIRNFYRLTAVTVMIGSSLALYSGGILPDNQPIFAAVSALLFITSLLGAMTMDRYRLKFLSYARRAEEFAE